MRLRRAKKDTVILSAVKSSRKQPELNAKGVMRMSAAHTIQTIIEVLALAALVVGFIYEPAVAKWEQKQGEKMLKAFKKRKEYRK